MEIKEKIKKLQELPERQKKIILFTIVGILALLMGCFWISGTINIYSHLNFSNLIPKQ